MSAALAIGDGVRVFFGAEFRDGTIEHIRPAADEDGEGYAVRLSPGWLHMERADRLLKLPSSMQPKKPVVTGAGAVPAARSFTQRAADRAAYLEKYLAKADA